MNDSTEPTVRPDPGVVVRYARAWEAGDIATLVGCYADDVVAHYGGRSPFAGTHRGKDRFLEVLITTAGLGNRRLVSVDQVHDDGETGAIFATETFDVDGETVTVQRALRYRIRDGLIAECWLFDMEQHLIDKAWTPPGVVRLICEG
jgi:uncharacterized protein